MAVITISRWFGAGGITLGEKLGERLGYRVVNEEMIKEVAERGGFTTEGVEAFEKQQGSKLMRFLDRMVKVDYLERMLSAKTGYLSEAKYKNIVTEIIEELYSAGDCVIIGRGGQTILKNRPDCYHFLLVRDHDNRVQFMMDKYGLLKEVAERVIAQHDRERLTFLKCFVDNVDDPQLYNLVVNTSRVDLDQTAELVLEVSGLR